MITGNNNVHEYLLVDSIKLFSHHKYYGSAAAASVGKCPESDYYIYCLVWLVWDSGSQKSVWIILLQYMRESLEADSSYLYAGPRVPISSVVTMVMVAAIVCYLTLMSLCPNIGDVSLNWHGFCLFCIVIMPSWLSFSVWFDLTWILIVSNIKHCTQSNLN